MASPIHFPSLVPDLIAVPDAVIIPESSKRGAHQIQRINTVLAIVEPILGVDRSRGQRGWIRRQPGGVLFVSKDPEDTIFYPLNHPREGQPRYRWEDMGHGLKLGYLNGD